MILSEPGANSKVAAMRTLNVRPVASYVLPFAFKGPRWVPLSQNSTSTVSPLAAISMTTFARSGNGIRESSK